MKQSIKMTWKKAAHTIRRLVNKAKRFCNEGEIEALDPRHQIWEKSANALHIAIKRFGQGEGVDTDTLTEIVRVGAFLGRKNKGQLNRITGELSDCMDFVGENFKEVQYIPPEAREILHTICTCYMMLDKGVGR